MLRLSVIIPTHNPNPDRLARTLAGLVAQTLAPAEWECLVIDNASRIPLTNETLPAPRPANTQVVRENTLGLTAARRCGFLAAQAPIVVLVDDDNVLAPDYLEKTITLFGSHPEVGALGGRIIPEFETAPEAWVREFDDLLACRDLGDAPQVSAFLKDPNTGRNEWPMMAPVGAGMALRRVALTTWTAESANSTLSDRKGNELTSGGDNDIVLTVMRAGWKVAYFPELTLTHLIPSARLTRDYLARLNHGIAKSWVQVLHKHSANPWPAIANWTVLPRKIKAWVKSRAWSSPAAYVRWQGMCGHFEGRALIRLHHSFLR